MTYELPIEDFGLKDEDGLLELPGKAWILVSIEDKMTYFDGFRIDFLNNDTSMMLVLHFAHKYNTDKEFRKAINAKIAEWERDQITAAQDEKDMDDYYNRRAM